MMAAVKRRLSGLALVTCLSLYLPLVSACSTLFMSPAERELDAQNCLEGFIDCFSSEKETVSFCLDGKYDSETADPEKKVLARIEATSFAECSAKRDPYSNYYTLLYGSLDDGDPSFNFCLSHDYTIAIIKTFWDEGIFGGCFSAAKYYSLDEADGKAIYAVAASVQAERESSVSKASSSSGKGGSASV
jgi:hypothetical protein